MKHMAKTSSTTLLIFSICWLLLIFLGGCKTQPAYHRVRLDSICSSQIPAKKICVIVSGDNTISEQNLQFQEFASYIRRALEYNGYTVTQELNQATIFIAMLYGIGDPKEHVYSYSVPVYGQTGYSSAHTSGTITNFGSGSQYSSTTTYQPSYGITGYSAHIGTYTTYSRHIKLDARNINDNAQLWQITAESAGASGDLRAAFPIMAAAMSNCIGINTGQQIEVDLQETDPSILMIQRYGSNERNPSISEITAYAQAEGIYAEKKHGYNHTCFWKHRDIDEIYVIEMNMDNVVIAGYGPIMGKLQPTETYILTTEKNAELQKWRNEDKLALFKVDTKELKRQYENAKAKEAAAIRAATRNYYKHIDTNDVYIIEINKQNIIIGSYGPVKEDIRPLYEYELTTDNIAKLQAAFEKKLIPLNNDDKRKLAGQMTTNFWKHHDSGEVYVIEMSWRDIIFAGYGPIAGKPEPIATYKLSAEKNAELQKYRDNDQLIWLGLKVE